ncbi:hypothetical protein AGMMS50212_05980 [Spirochaetia bacterium]|nr:hypothetical protein AGMMS50212_05980 [Spirochaetia bacterium]
MRVEIIANNSVEENIFEEFKTEGVAKYYTKMNNVHGVGSSGPRMGDAIWPEENFVLIIWCELEEALGIERALKRIKTRFPLEGVKLFGLHELSTSALLTDQRRLSIEYKGGSDTTTGEPDSADPVQHKSLREKAEALNDAATDTPPEDKTLPSEEVPIPPPKAPPPVIHLPDGLGMA